MDRLIAASIIPYILAFTACGPSAEETIRAKALQDFRDAKVVLASSPTNATFLKKAAKLHEEQKEPCRAMERWAILGVMSEKDSATAKKEVQRLKNTPECSTFFPTQSITIKQNTVDDLHTFSAKLGEHDTEVIFDTASLYSYSSQDFLKKIPNAERVNESFRATTGLGKMEGELYHVPGPLRLGEMEFPEFDLLVLKNLNAPAELLLGQTLLSRFKGVQRFDGTWNLSPSY